MRTDSKIAIVGQGYVGLPLAVLTSNAGYFTIGIDTDQVKVMALKSGKSYIEDVGDAHIQEVIASGRYQPSSDYSLIAGADIVVFCLPTPVDTENQPDLSILLHAVNKAAPHFREGCVVISESTSYPGTLRNLIAPVINSHGKSAVRLGVAPERVDPANTSFMPNQIPRLVSGLDSEATERVKEFYESLGMIVITTSTPEVAEAAKLLENTFRQVNIALVNEFAKVATALDIDVREVIEAAATKPYGFMKFSPGPGVGGHCIPVDPHYLTWISKKHGFQASLVELANEINDEMPKYVVSRFVELFPDGVARKQILIAGIAYKYGVSDFRESPALKIISLLNDMGAHVSWYDLLIREHRGENSSDLESAHDGVVVTLPKLELPLGRWVSSGVKVFDCTGFYGDVEGLHQL